MIDCKQEALPEEQQLKLKKWLSAPECNRMIEVVEGKAKRLLAESSVAAMKATGDNSYSTAADGFVIKARRYQMFLDVLAEIQTQAEPFTKSKLS